MADKVPKAPEAPIVTDAAMEALLREAYGGLGADFGYMVDLVTVTVSRDKITEACQLAKGDKHLQMDYLSCLSIAEYEESYQAVYLLWSTKLRHKFALKTNAPKDDASIPSVTGVWRGANWYEREGAELFGVSFAGHPNPGFLLLFDEFEGKYPLRKDYPFEETPEWSAEDSPLWETPPDDKTAGDHTP